MRVALSHEFFSGFAGSETYTLTVADELALLGHEVSITARELGPIAAFARSQGHRVLPLEDHLDPQPDLIIASDLATLHVLAARHPGAVRLFVAHSVDFVLQFHPRLRDVCQATIVMNDRVRATVQERAGDGRVVRLRQPIDLRRFGPLAGAGPPGTVILLSNYVAGERSALIERACRARGWTVQRIGLPGTVTATPELALAEGQVGIGLGRSALESMAAGRATYVFGVLGSDGWVTPETYPAIEADGFAGTGRPEVVLDEAALIADLGRWDPAFGEVGRDLVSQHHSARSHALALMDLARELDPAPPPTAGVAEEIAYLVRQQFRLQRESTVYLHDVERLRRELADSAATVAHDRQQQAALRHEIDVLRGELGAVRGREHGLRSHLEEVLEVVERQRALLDRVAVRTVLRLIGLRRRWRSKRAR